MPALSRAWKAIARPRMLMTAEEVSGSQRVIRGLSTRKRAISLAA